MQMPIQKIPEDEALSIELDAAKDESFQALLAQACPGLDADHGQAWARLKLTKSYDSVILEGSLKSSLRPQCARCLEFFEKPLDLTIQHTLLPKQTSKLSGEDAEDHQFSLYENETIELGQILHELISLELPMRFLCYPDCKGLCEQCGSNLNNINCDCADKKAGNPFSVLKKMKIR
jgi:uncharacterized protein